MLALKVHGSRQRGQRPGLGLEGPGEGQSGGLRVLDAMCGSGVRALRYIEEGGATFVQANDANDDLEHEREANLRACIASGSAALSTGDAADSFFSARLERTYYDMIDVDGFGSGAPHSAEAWWALRIGGLLYLCSTDARSAAGKNKPAAAWRGFGAVAQAMPASNELGVRLLVADAVRQAAARGFEAVPVFGVFHRQSSCSRVMLRLTAAGRSSCPRSAEEAIAFAAYCGATGEHWVLPLGQCHDPRAAPTCPAAARHASLAAAAYTPELAAAALRITGPIWAGALCDKSFVCEMAEAASARDDMREAAKVLDTLLQEARQELPPMYFRLKEVGKFLGMEGISALPRKSKLVGELRARGFAAGDAQAEAQAIKTSAPMAEVVAAARMLVQGGKTG